MTADESALAERLQRLDEQVAEAARAAGRHPDEITRIVVTKFHPPELVSSLHGLGVRDVGESRVQELVEKEAAVGPRDGLRWHFVGQVQTNKARAVRSAVSVVHSLDRERLAAALAAADPHGVPLDVFLQVNLTDDPARGGVAPAGLAGLAEHVAALESLRVRGVMAVAPLGEHPEAAFSRLADYGAQLRRTIPDATWMSAGMSGDFAPAILAGATHLRIGTAITGPRPVRG